jgi:FkbH-like protein
MFEFEHAEKLTPDLLPKVGWEACADYGRHRIRSFATVSWGEHCTECAFPTCYTTCSFYQPRQDGRCRRFEYGIFRADRPKTWLPYSAYLKFRNWSMLWAQGNATQLPPALADLLASLGRAAWLLSAPFEAVVRWKIGQKRMSLALQSLRRRTIKWIGAQYRLFPPADAFLLELYNPESSAMRVRLWIRGRMGDEPRRFEWGDDARPGFSSFRIPMGEISALVDCALPFDMGLTIEHEEGRSLYVCSAHFVRFREAAPVVTPQVAKKVKCLVWDLDHTIWDGVLVEGQQGEFPSLRDGVRSVLTELDKRGILLSIASKNSEEDARHALARHGIERYFLAPQIHWQPKSQSLRAIAAQLNIGLDTLALIDDQPFEREEVAANAPEARVYDASEMLAILGKPEFAGDASSGGPNRRELYQTELKRTADFQGSGTDYDAFLASCALKAVVRPARADDLPRIQDIVQRTNQLNTSARRYGEEELLALLGSNSHRCHLAECSDRYGTYGQVGFLVFELHEGGATLTDCMFSCRIQGKRVDEAILRRLLNALASDGRTNLLATYVRSERNAPAFEMLRRSGFQGQASTSAALPLACPTPLQEISFIEVEIGP